MRKKENIKVKCVCKLNNVLNARIVWCFEKKIVICSRKTSYELFKPRLWSLVHHKMRWCVPADQHQVETSTKTFSISSHSTFLSTTIKTTFHIIKVYQLNIKLSLGSHLPSLSFHWVNLTKTYELKSNSNPERKGNSCDVFIK